jgi:hypothetical protein
MSPISYVSINLNLNTMYVQFINFLNEIFVLFLVQYAQGYVNLNNRKSS